MRYRPREEARPRLTSQALTINTYARDGLATLQVHSKNPASLSVLYSVVVLVEISMVAKLDLLVLLVV